ncbi:MAG: TldD/PmbA family protein [Geminicoccaceae bacterium]
MAMSDADAIEKVLELAAGAGADGCDAMVINAHGLSATQRLGELEMVESEESRRIGVRFFNGRRQAVVSGGDLSPDGLDRLIAQAAAIARELPEDRYCGLAEPDQLQSTPAGLETPTSAPPAIDRLIDRARACEDAALSIPRITNSEGASASWSLERITLGASNGLRAAYERPRHSLGVSVIASADGRMEVGYEYRSAVVEDDLPSPIKIGRDAATRASRKLGARKVATQDVPVVFDPMVANGLILNFLSLISGPRVTQGTTFLKDRMGEAVFSEAIMLREDPFLAKGLRSRPIDAEGLAPRAVSLIDAGRLQSWLLDLTSARQLELAPTGHATRSLSGTPSPNASNVWIEPGALSRADLLKDVGTGLYVTEFVGRGFDPITGDYSRGAAGYWIEGGELAFPVSEVTIAGNLKDMFAHLTPANDLELRYGVDAPTLAVARMTVGGQ